MRGEGEREKEEEDREIKGEVRGGEEERGRRGGRGGEGQDKEDEKEERVRRCGFHTATPTRALKNELLLFFYIFNLCMTSNRRCSLSKKL